MSRLCDKISEACAKARDGLGVTVVQQAVAFARTRLDDEDRDVLVDEALARRCKTVAEKGRRSVEAAAARPSAVADLFPDLRQGYSLWNDERCVKDTSSLTQIEFERLVAIREKQIEDDRAHLKVLRLALDTMRPLWRKHPDWTFGDCCEAHRKLTPAEMRRSA